MMDYVISLSKATASDKSAPAKRLLTNWFTKNDPAPDFFSLDEKGQIKVDPFHPLWLFMLAFRRQKKGNWMAQWHTRSAAAFPEGYKSQPYFHSQGDDPSPSHDINADVNADYDEITQLKKEAIRAELLEPILKVKKLQLSNEREENILRKQAGELVEFSLAEFLFFGYMEKINFEILRVMKKIKPIITNLVQEQDSAGILKRVQRELETILREVKTQQKKDLADWKAEP